MSNVSPVQAQLVDRAQRQVLVEGGDAARDRHPPIRRGLPGLGKGGLWPGRTCCGHDVGARGRDRVDLVAVVAKVIESLVLGVGSGNCGLTDPPAGWPSDRA
jgi:hypothetical protein